MFLSVDDSNRVLLIRFDGVLTDEMLLARYEEARRWLSLHGGASQLSDFRDVTSFRVTPQGIRKLAERPPLAPDPFLRVVVSPGPLIFGMTRMFEILGGETRDRVHITKTIEEAHQVLGISNPNFAPVSDF